MSTITTANGSASNVDSNGALSHLSTRIRSKITEIDAYLADACQRRDRLVHVSIVGGAVAAALTAPPALGGKSFSTWLEHAFGMTAPAWQLLCLGAMLCSLAATIATQLHRSKSYDTMIARAHESRCDLETLDVGLTLGHFNVGDATSRYLQCLEELPFIDARSSGSVRRPPRGAMVQPAHATGAETTT